MTTEAQQAQQIEGWSMEIRISHYRVDNGELVREYHDSLYNGSLTEAEARAWYQRAYSCMGDPPLRAGADALRQQKEKQQRPICADGFHKAESLDSPHRRCVNCGHEWVFPAASNLPAAERSSPAGLPARLQDARGTLMAAIGRFRVSGQLDPVTDAVDAYEALYQPSPVGLAAILREYQAQHKDDCAEMATCPDCRYRFNQCGHFDHCGPYQPSCTCGLAALITPSGDEQ